MHTLDSLVGRTIRAVWINADRTLIVFDTDTGRLAFFTEGDCCSSSWVEHVENAESLVGGTVVDVELLDMPNPTSGSMSPPCGDDDYNPDYHTVQAYGLRVDLAGRPPFLLEFRNMSNGYYGGHIVPVALSPEMQDALLSLADR